MKGAKIKETEAERETEKGRQNESFNLVEILDPIAFIPKRFSTEKK